MVGLLPGQGLLDLIYPRLLTEFGMLVFFTKLGLMEFQVRYLALFLLFSIIGGFRWFWVRNLHKNIQLMLEFLKGAFLVLHFSYCTLITFLMMLSVILPSMLMILLSTVNVIRHLICGSNWYLVLVSKIKSDLQDTVDWERKWLVNFNAGKTQLVSFDQSKNTGVINVKMDVFVLLIDWMVCSCGKIIF